MSNVRKTPRVRFLLPPCSSRPARDDELQAAKNFKLHTRLCYTCLVDEPRGIVVLCTQGSCLAEDVQRLLSWKHGCVQGCVEMDSRYFSERVELPDRYSLIRSLLRTNTRPGVRKASDLTKLQANSSSGGVRTRVTFYRYVNQEFKSSRTMVQGKWLV